MTNNGTDVTYDPNGAFDAYAKALIADPNNEESRSNLRRLADEVRNWGQWVKEQAEKELAEFYPKDPDGATPIAYLWAREY